MQFWLDEKLLSPYDYWQFWRNVDDRDVIKFLKMFTDLEMLKKLINLQNKDINESKSIKLANKTTAMLHGKKSAENSEQAANERLFPVIILDANLPSIKIKSKEHC